MRGKQIELTQGKKSRPKICLTDFSQSTEDVRCTKMPRKILKPSLLSFMAVEDTPDDNGEKERYPHTAVDHKHIELTAHRKCKRFGPQQKHSQKRI
jgi:hypothetical protein